jgi:hypothetical protein
VSVQRLAIIAALVASSAAFAAPARAQSVRLEFHDGLVTVVAQNAPLRSILAEWSRLGGTKIVNGDRVPGGPVTIELTNVPERQAIDVLLRGASGYLIGPQLPAATGRSSFDSVLILPTSTAPRPATAPPGFAPPQPRFDVPFPQPDPDDPEENPPGDIGPNGRRVPPQLRFRLPQQQQPGNPEPAPQPFQPDPDDEPQPPPEDRPAVTSPFGVPAGSSRPGVITPVPQAPRQNQRPQGDPEP